MPFGGLDDDHDIKGFKTPKILKRAWLGIFQPKWQNYTIVISPAGNIGSIPGELAAQVVSLGLRVGGRLASFYIHLMNLHGELLQWFCHDDSTINIGICIIIIQ